MNTGKILSRLFVVSGVLGAGLGAATGAKAGAFAVHEQSAYFQGMSFAGAAAGGELSSMFWNSAAAAAVAGVNSESSYTLVIPDSSIDCDKGLAGGLFCNVGLPRSSGDIGDPTVIPASYMNYQLTDRLFLGLALNSPFGFVTKPDNTNWAGSPIGVTSKVFSLDVNPTLAYKLTPELTIGAGVQVEYIKIRLRSGPFALPTPAGAIPFSGREVKVDDVGVGATAGMIWQPRAGTTIGVGYRSPIDFDTDGTCKGSGLTTLLAQGAPAPCDIGGRGVHASATLPETVTLSLRQSLTERLAVLGTVEWTNWSRLGTLHIKNDAGATVDELPLNYNDGWFYSIGAEYLYNPRTTLRAGVAWENSPITDANRLPLLPDNDRLWLSVGASYKYSDKLSFDFAYSHLFLDDADMNVAAQGVGTLFAGSADNSIDIVSAGFKYKLGGPQEELEPYK
jgi:long-chain fatty acid transport protein